MRLFDLVLGAFALALLVAIVLLLRLSTMQPPAGSLVFGSGTVWRGRTACFRVAATQGDASEWAPHPTAHFALRDSHGVRSETSASGELLAEATLPVPADLEDLAWLDVRVELGGDADHDDHVTIPVHSVASPQPLAGRLPPWQEILQPAGHTALPKNPALREVRIELYPESGALVGGLVNEVWGRASLGGRPWSGTVKSDALQLGATTTPEGLFHFAYRPPPQGNPLRFALGPHPTDDSLELPVQARASQLMLRAHPATVVGPGENLEVHIDALPFRAPVMVDVWWGNTLTSGGSVALERNQVELTVQLPHDATGFFYLMAYRNILAPTDSSSIALRWLGAPTDRAQLLSELARLGGDTALIHAAQENSNETLLQLALSRFEPEPLGPHLLASSGADRTGAFERQRAAARQQIYLVSGFLGVVGTALAVGWVIRHQQRLRRDVGHVVDEGLEAGDDMDPHLARDVGNVRFRWYLALTLLAMAAAGYGVFTILSRMRWH